MEDIKISLNKICYTYTALIQTNMMFSLLNKCTIWFKFLTWTNDQNTREGRPLNRCMSFQKLISDVQKYAFFKIPSIILTLSAKYFSFILELYTRMSSKQTMNNWLMARNQDGKGHIIEVSEVIWSTSSSHIRRPGQSTDT